MFDWMLPVWLRIIFLIFGSIGFVFFTWRADRMNDIEEVK
jgi:hypothetical protein